MEHILREGDIAPDFSLKDQHGNTISKSDFQGKKLVLYFYPKDSTPGCTAEACNLRDNYNVLLKEGFSIVGVSADSIKSHEKFSQKNDLPFSILSDPDLQMIKQYGVWQLKKFMGREYMGIVRTTFILDEEGKVEKVFEKVKTKDHSNQILQSL